MIVLLAISTFDGNNKYISNVKIGKTDALNSDYIYYGLFCSIKDAQIKIYQLLI